MKYYAITCIRGHQGARNDNALITFYVEAKDIITAAKVAQRMGGIKHTKMPLNCKQITKEEYDQWRYKYPEYDHKPGWVKTIPSQGLNDLIVNALKENKD